MIVTLKIPGKPQPKQRARRGKGGRFYTPRETRDFERSVAQYGLGARMRTGERWSLVASYRVRVECFMPDRRKRDADNVAKAVLDGLNGILWDDDTQVVELTTTKAVDRENPRTVVTVEIIQ